MLRYIVAWAGLLPAALLSAAPLRTLEPEAAPAPAKAKGVSAGAKAVSKPAGKGKAVNIEGQEYRSLDDYLAKLERDGWVGKPWYREVRPGVYELVTNLKPAPKKRLFTRAELERQFGFTR